jgi:DNA polymerase I-like protein with 3'-5' exonuclease and polymerase domains
MIINYDKTQIEIVVLAYLSEDKALIKLIQDGTDLYKFFAALMYDKSISEINKEERDSLKAPVLGISYGRGANALATESGKSKEWCQDFIDKFYEMFPGVYEMHQRWIKEVNRTGYLEMFTGIRFKFKKYVWNNKTKKKEVSTAWNAKYWEPEIKNYPVQHTAFVILSTYVAEFYRKKALPARNFPCQHPMCSEGQVYTSGGQFNCLDCKGTGKKPKYLMILTVHDSLMLDCRPEYVEEAQNDLKEVLDNLKDTLYNKYGMLVTVPIKADIQVADSWYDCK